MPLSVTACCPQCGAKDALLRAFKCDCEVLHSICRATDAMRDHGFSKKRTAYHHEQYPTGWSVSGQCLVNHECQEQRRQF